MLRLDKHYLSAYGLTSDERNWVTLDPRAADAAAAYDIPFEKIGVFVLEPGNASGTVNLPPAGLIKDIAEKVRSNGGWVVADEVTTGMGRTGKWFGSEHYSIKPDIVACGKGLGNGYPVSAVTISRRVFEKLRTSGFAYAQSHQNDPLGCAVAKAVIDTIRDEGLIDRSAARGMLLKEKLTALSNKYPCIKEVRGAGLMCAVEFGQGSNEAGLTDIHKKLFEAGYIAGLKPSARLLRFYPPLIIPEELIESLADALDGILSAL
jgi:acetylornithine aminotransferase